jgi:hypothetical protein
MIAYPPALFFGDSWGYLATAFAGHFVSLPYLRPVGYSLLIWILTIPGRDLVQLIALQHLAGLATGCLIYVSLLRAQVPRTLAAIAAALVLLDGYTITLEQYVMADTFYTLTLLIAVLLLVWPRLDPGADGRSTQSLLITSLSGLLVAASALEREVSLWVLPTFVVFLIWTRVGWRPLLAFVVAFAVPVGAYAAVMKEKSGVLGLTATSGRTLYSRVAGFADCSGAGIASDARVLCETKQQRDSHATAPDWYMFAKRSPAQLYFNVSREDTAQRAHSNSVLGGFARAIILHQPAAYAGSIATDFLDFFAPGATAYKDSVSATSLPTSARLEATDPGLRRRILPGVRPAVRAPAPALRRYRSVVHVPRLLLAVLAIAAIAALILKTAGMTEVFLTSGTALLLLFGTAATGGFGLRYLLPAVPLLAIGGVIAGRDLVARAPRALHSYSNG